jgi:isoquinoline 1-oxidoreductase beta subunit
VAVKTTAHSWTLDRRDFIICGLATGGLAIGLAAAPVSAQTLQLNEPTNPELKDLLLNQGVFDIWLSVGPDESIVVKVANSEMGQGVMTALPMILAEELDADWANVRAELSPTADIYFMPGDIGGGNRQMAGNSYSISRRYLQMRYAGAMAREMLIAAAASRWKVATDQCRTQAGYVLHPEGEIRLGYGEVATQAAALTLPTSPRLKEASNFKIIGRSLPRLDIPDKVMGKAVYGIDIAWDGLLVAAIRRSPVFGGKIKSINASVAEKMPGVQAVLALEDSVAVVAERYWQAAAALQQVQIVFGSPDGPLLNSPSIERLSRDSLDRNGKVMLSVGNWDRAAKGANLIAADYYSPLMTHVCLEPPNCTIDLGQKYCNVWIGTQENTLFQKKVAELTGLPLDRITIHVPYLGGGFGRRTEAHAELVQAVEIAKRIRRPVKLIWSREEDIQQGYYRLPAAVRMTAVLDDAGRPAALKAVVATPSLIEGFYSGIKLPGGDPTSVYALAERIIYAIPDRHTETVQTDIAPIPTGPFRGVGYSANVFALESFIDELAEKAGQDPFAYRRRMLAHWPQALAVLERAAALAGWDRLPVGQHAGLAVHEIEETVLAIVVVIAPGEEVLPRILRVVAAIDCGRAINPDGVRAQVEGSILMGLSSALFEEIHLRQGAVVEHQLGDGEGLYRILSMAEAPKIEVTLVASNAPPAGVGECGVPGTGAALANALYRMTGKRLRTMPFAPQLAD